MSVLYTKSEPESKRLRAASICELEKLIEVARAKGETLATLALNKHLTSIDIMLLDSAFKGLDLNKADKTLLVLEDKYIIMLHKLIWILIQTLTASK